MMKVLVKIVNLPSLNTPEPHPFDVWRKQGLEVDMISSGMSVSELKHSLYALLCDVKELPLPAHIMTMIINGKVAQDQQVLRDCFILPESENSSLVVHVVVRDWTEIKRRHRLRRSIDTTRAELSTAFNRPPEKNSSSHEPDLISSGTVQYVVDSSELKGVLTPSNYNGPVIFWNGTAYILKQSDEASSSLPSFLQDINNSLSQNNHQDRISPMDTSSVTQVEPARPVVTPRQPIENRNEVDERNRMANRRNHVWIALRLGFLVYILSQNSSLFKFLFFCCTALLIYLYQRGKIQLHVPVQTQQSTGFSSRNHILSSIVSFFQRLNEISWVWKAKMIFICFFGSLIPGSPYENPRAFTR